MSATVTRFPTGVAGCMCDGRYAVQPTTSSALWEMWAEQPDATWRRVGKAPEADAKRWAIEGGTVGQLDLFAEVAS